MKSMNLRVFLVAWTCMGMMLSPVAGAATAAIPSMSHDVSLHQGGVLLGQVVDQQGKALTKSPVSISQAGKEVARVVTDNSGNFSVPNLKGGLYQVTTVGHTNSYRCWAANTAPPAARKGLMLVSNNELIRAQDCGSGVCCGSGVSCGSGCGGGGLLGWMADHPIITAGAIGAAIAIPLAVDDDDDPATP